MSMSQWSQPKTKPNQTKPNQTKNRILGNKFVTPSEVYKRPPDEHFDTLKESKKMVPRTFPRQLGRSPWQTGTC
jgi:hypothetical protein